MRVLIAAVVAALVAAAAASARPKTPPPKVGGVATSPPPAWVRVGTAERWLAFSSFCWRTVCADMLPPQLRPDLPTIHARVGQTLTLHLGFAPTSVALREVPKTGTGRSWRLRAAGITTWRVRRVTLILVEAKGAAGSAGYAAKLRF